MNCKSIHKLILGKNSSELSHEEYEIIQNHILTCPGCREYLKKAINAEEYLLALSKSKPMPFNDDLIADSILSNIIPQKKSLYSKSFIVNLFYWIQKDIVRYAFIAILLIIIGFYGYQEYYTVNRLYSLEMHLTQISANDPGSVVIPAQITNGVSWVYDIYKYLNGSTNYLELRGNTIVINKSNLKKLLMDYSKLNYNEQREVMDLKKQLFPELFEKQITDQDNLIINKLNLEKQIKLLNTTRGSHEK